MKALKTIVATAMIVFALTTVAMAGARHLGGSDDAAKQAAGPAATQINQAAGVTLTDEQFARLLHAVNGKAAKPHTTQADRATHRDRLRDHARTTASTAAKHAQAPHRAQGSDAAAGTHDDGATHNGGTHVDATHVDTTHTGGTHDGGANHE